MCNDISEIVERIFNNTNTIKVQNERRKEKIATLEKDLAEVKEREIDLKLMLEKVQRGIAEIKEHTNYVRECDEMEAVLSGYEEAKAFLQEQLADGARVATDILTEGDARNIKRAMIRKAMAEMNIKTQTKGQGKNKKLWWRLDESHM